MARTRLAAPRDVTHAQAPTPLPTSDVAHSPPMSTSSTKETPAQASPSSTPAPAASAFRFLDLPAEIRNRIYFYAVLGPNSVTIYNLANFDEPALTAVSHQVYNEVLPVMFAECNFEISVGSDLLQRGKARRAGRAAPRRRKGVQSKAGTLGVKRSIMRFIRESKAAAVFRHIKFDIYAVQDVQRHYRMSTLSLDYASQELKSSVSSRMIFAQYGQYDFNVVDMNAAAADASAVARALAERTGFIGFGIKDLDKIAKGFRFVK
ncbi:hypothetical protein LTR85_005467 [Meristemomyces frigidus]|nr:hypothetical protein LTR85_005467 [Meristemomyces frigidus]